MEYNFCNYTIRWQMSKSANDFHPFFAQALTISEIKIYIFNLQKKVTVMEDNFHYDTIQLQISKSTNDSHTFLR